MQRKEVFQVLGIEETKDESVIKNAYRERLAVTNPEDNPEGFKRLRTAYEEACAYARQPEEAGERQEEDNTPSGLWVRQAEPLYRDITKRCDVNCWKALFDQDIFLSLEEEENCRYKLLCFLMDHFKLPTEVWKLLDRRLGIVAGASGLRERFPADFVHYIVTKSERGEDLDFSQFEGAPDASYDLYLQYYDNCWNALQEGNLDQAQSYIQNAEELSIFHPVMEVCRAHLLLEREQVQEATDLMEGLRKRYPSDAMVSYNTAEIFWNHDRRDQAAGIYRELKAENDAHYMANVRLTEWYYEQGQFETAKKCAEKVVSLGADDKFMELLAKVNREIERDLEKQYYGERDVNAGLELGWCYLQDGNVSQGIRIAQALEGRVPEERFSEHLGLLTKLYMEETEYELALPMAERWKAALEMRLSSDENEEEKNKDRDRVRQFHVIRMQCWRAQGDVKREKPEVRRELYEKAIREAEGLLDGSQQDIGLLLEMAQIYMEMEEYEKCLELTERLVEEFQVYAAYATETEVYRRQWNASGVVQSGRRCIHYFPSYIRCYELVAKVFLDLEQSAELDELVEDAKKQGIESVILEAYQYRRTHEVPDMKTLEDRLKEFRNVYFRKVEEGSREAYKAGLPLLTEYLYWYPGPYMLVERGLFHRAAGEYEKAKADFEKALSEDHCQPYALNGLSVIFRYQGDYEKALIYLKRAHRYRDEEAARYLYADMSELYSLLGDHERALEYYKKYVNESAYRQLYHLRRLALSMARAGDVAQAVETARLADEKDRFKQYESLTLIFQVAGEGQRAAETLAEWNREITRAKGKVKEEYRVSFHVRAAWQSLMYGDGSQAVRQFGEALLLEGDNAGGTHLSDIILVCILCGKQEKGREYAARLGQFLKRREADGQDLPAAADKESVLREFLSAYYEESEDKLEQILARGGEASVCRSCCLCLCRELEAARIMFMLRRGQREEAFARLESNLKRLPGDEYMLAIRNMCEKNPEGIPEGKRAADGEAGLLSRLKGLFKR